MADTKKEVTTFGDVLTVPLTEKQFRDLTAIQNGLSPSGDNIGKKMASVILGYDHTSAEATVDEMFWPDVHMHPSFDSTKNLADQNLDMARLVAYATTCACAARTCCQSNGMGCSLSRDPEAMLIFANAVKLEKVVADKTHYTLTIQLRSTDKNPQSVERAYKLFTRNSPILVTGDMCAETAACVNSCTFSRPDVSLASAAKAWRAAHHRREGVLESGFETLLKMLARMTGIEKESFVPVEVTKPETIAIIGAGPGGVSAAITAAKKGYQVHLYDMQSGFGGAARSVIPQDKFSAEDLEVYGAGIENMGIITHYNTKIGTSLTEAEVAAGIALVTPEQLQKEHDVVIANPGIYNHHHSRRLGGIEGEDGRGVIGAEQLLAQTEKYMSEYLNVQALALATEYTKGDQTFDEVAFKHDHLRTYFAEHPFTLKVADEIYSLEELSQMEIFLVGVQDTGHDIARRLMQLFTLGDKDKFNTTIHWMARKPEGDTPREWGDEDPYYPMEEKPTVKMMRELQQRGAPIKDEYLVFIDQLHRDQQGNLLDITLGTKEIANPIVAGINPASAKFANGDKKSATLVERGKKPLVIAATGYETNKFVTSELGQALNIQANAKGQPGNNFHSHYNAKQDSLILLGGNVALPSQQTIDSKDLVVEVLAAGVLAATHADNYLNAARGKQLDEKPAIAEANAENVLKSAEVFGRREEEFTLANIIRNKQSRDAAAKA